MQINPSKTRPWPPSPSVEDELTALANEYSIDTSIETLKSDDHLVPSRGIVEQEPIIMDSPDLRNSEGENTSTQTNLERFSSDTSSSDDAAGPLTPPPLSRDEGKRFKQADSDYHGEALKTSSNLERQTSTRSRPQVSRIHTDMGGDVRAMATGNRRPPSPYSYTRTPTYHGSNTGHAAADDTLLTPAQPVASPMSFDHQGQLSPFTSSRRSDRDTVPHNVNMPTAGPSRPSRGNDINVYTPNGDGASNRPQYLQPEVRTPQSATYRPARRSFHETRENIRNENLQPAPSYSRRQSKESTYGSSGEERADAHRPGFSRRSTRDPRDSPYTSATEESSRGHVRRDERHSGDDRKKLRRKSSHRRERPVLIDSRSESNLPSALDGPESNYYRHETRERTNFNPITPVSGDAGRAAMEDYFEKAFRENENRRSFVGRGARSSGSALASPMTSPPRTPRSERLSRDYFDSTPTAQRPIQRSRPPSMDESQFMDLKAPNTLLSAATAGAALAARASGTSPKSSGASPEDGASTSTSKAASTPRSRRHSPVLEGAIVPAKIATYSPSDSTYSSRGPPTSNYDSRLSFRTGGTGAESPHTLSHPSFQPHLGPHSDPRRALSYSSMEPQQSWNGSYPNSAVSPFGTVIITGPGQSNITSQPRSARSSLSPTEASMTLQNSFGLPPCPRPQPVVGYRDWYTIKDISDIEICPSCVSVVGNTRYRDLFIPSLPRPYNEPSVCAMSKTWNRIAFMQSIRQNRPNLNLLRRLTSQSKDHRPCAGGKEDIRKWYQVTDPQTKEAIPDFFACSACVDVVDEVFPDVCKLFSRPKNALNQEQSCNLHVASKHFPSIIDHLDHAHSRCKNHRWHPADVEGFIRHVLRVARYQSCSRDEMQFSRTWHFMPEFLDFTICEECYDEVVRPINDRPLAREISKTLKTVPIRRGSVGNSGISCQLYSERMRKVFHDAINERNFPILRDAVKARVSQQQRLYEQNKSYEQDMKFGIDRRQEMRRNQNIWREKFE